MQSLTTAGQLCSDYAQRRANLIKSKNSLAIFRAKIPIYVRNGFRLHGWNNVIVSRQILSYSRCDRTVMQTIVEPLCEICRRYYFSGLYDCWIVLIVHAHFQVEPFELNEI